MNPDNNLFEAVLAEYLANNSESTAQIANVNISGIAINGSRDSTNPNYLSNYWEDNNAWFYAHNVDLPGVPGWSTTNDRVPPDDIRSITIYATVGEEDATYIIPRSELDVRVLSGDVIIEIYLRDTSEEEVTPPTAPSEETVIELAGENAVAVECTTNEEHGAAT